MIEFNLKKIDVSSCAFYDTLKQSPLAKGRDDSTIEEVAVWLDTNGGSTRAGITEILKAIDNNFHNDKTDRLDNPLSWHLSKILRNTRYGASNTQYASNAAFLPELRAQYFSNNALYWIFMVFSETNSLDNAILDSKFIDFAKKTRDSHREKSMKLKSEYMWQTIISLIDQQLYEVFAKLVNIIDQKLTKRSQSLLS